MNKPIEYKYYDYYQVFDYLIEKHQFTKPIDDIFLRWIKGWQRIENGTIVTVNLQSTKSSIGDATPPAIFEIIELLKEFNDKEISLKIWW